MYYSFAIISFLIDIFVDLFLFFVKVVKVEVVRLFQYYFCILKVFYTIKLIVHIVEK